MKLHEVRIESERLVQVPIEERWATEIFREFTPEVTRYMSPAPAAELADTLAYISWARGSLDRGEDLSLVILDRATGEFLGCCGVNNLATREPELGLWVKLPAHGHGYGREAIQALATWGREHLEFDAYLYPVDRRNVPSRKIPESLGGRIVREFRSTGQAGQDLDQVEYRIPR